MQKLHQLLGFGYISCIQKILHSESEGTGAPFVWSLVLIDDCKPERARWQSALPGPIE